PPIDHSIDVGRSTPVITLTVPARIAAHAPSLKVVIEAHEADGMGPPRAYEGPVDLRIGGRNRSSLDVSAGRVESEELGPFGRAGQRITVEASIDANELRNAATVSKTVLLTAKSTLTLSADGDRVSPAALLFVAGALGDDDGGVAGADVVIGLEGGADLAAVVTDAAGHFATWIKGPDP